MEFPLVRAHLEVANRICIKKNRDWKCRSERRTWLGAKIQLVIQGYEHKVLKSVGVA